MCHLSINLICLVRDVFIDQLRLVQYRDWRVMVVVGS